MTTKIVLKNMAWIPENQVGEQLLSKYVYKKKVNEKDDKGEWIETEEEVILPRINKKNELIGFPRGNILKLLSNFNEVELIDKRSMSSLDFNLELLSHVTEDERWLNQKKLLKLWLKNKGGIVKSPAASGKSVLAIAAICELNLKTLCIFDKRDFKNQWLEELHRHTNIRDIEEKTGKKQAGNYDGDEFYPVTFTTYQKLISRKGKKFIKKNENYFGLIVVDEVHHSASPAFRETISRFNPLTFLGVTATPERKDGLHLVYQDFLGPIAAESDAEQLTPLVTVIPTGFTVKQHKRYPSFAQWNYFLKQLCGDPERNKLIINWILKDIHNKRTILVVSDRVNHCFLLKNLLIENGVPEGQIAVAIGGVSSNRDKIYEDVRQGNYQVLISSKVIDEGVNIPKLDTLHFATPIASKPKIEQRIGRVRRPQKEKKRPLVRDYVDKGDGMIYGAARAREKVYGKIGAEIQKLWSEYQIHSGIGLPILKSKKKCED